MPRLFPLLLLFGLLPAGAARADRAGAGPGSATDSLAYGVALKYALEAAPEAELFRLDDELVAARSAQAGRGLNPELSLEIEDVSGVYSPFGEMNTTLSVQQRIERGGKRGARRALAEAHAPVTRLERLLFENERARDVRDLFGAGLAAQARLVLAEENHAEARELMEIVRLKVEAGRISRVEITRAEAWQKGTELVRLRREREMERVRHQLRRLMGPDAPAFTRLAGRLDTLAAPGAFADSLDLIRQSPSIARLESERRLREAALALERSAGAMDLDVALGVRHVGADDGLTFVGGVTFGLPFRDRNQGGILAATLERSRLAGELEARTRRIERDLRDLDARIADAQLVIRTLRREILPLAHEAWSGLEGSYLQGRTTYLDVFDARRHYAEARAEELDLLLELHTLDSERLRLLGRLRGDAGDR